MILIYYLIIFKIKIDLFFYIIIISLIITIYLINLHNMDNKKVDKDQEKKQDLIKTSIKRSYSGNDFSVIKKINIEKTTIDTSNETDNYNDDELITCSVCGNIWDGFAQCYPCNLEDVE